MKIEKVINNNIVLSRDNNDNEIILMGRGLGFNVKSNELIDVSKIQKTFVINEPSNSFLQALLQMPIQYIELAEDIVSYATSILQKKITDNVYVSLVDHIETSIERYHGNIKLKNVLLWEVKQFYKDEFKIGLYALKRIKELYQIEMLEDEAAFIAIHFVTSQLEESIPTVYKVTTFMNEVIQFVEQYFNVVLDVDSSSYFRFTTHLKYFAQRLFSQMKVKDSDDKELLNVIMNRYPEAYACTQQLKLRIQEKYGYQLSDDECLFLTIHITKVTIDCYK